MRVKSSNKLVKGLSCIDPLRNIYRLRWDFDSESYEEIELSHKPSREEIRSIIEDYYNKQIENKIINGFIYKGNKVYLSRENQINYCLFADSGIVPRRLKFGTDENPVFYTFNTVEELNEFKLQITSHINDCLQLGWNLKKNIDLSIY